MNSAARRGSYRVDRPYLLVAPVLLVVAQVVYGVVTGQLWPLVGAALVSVCCAVGLYTNRRGKFQTWGWLLDDFEFAGDERVLDIGCGRGAVLMLAAHRLTHGQAVGVDLWRRRDHSGNAAAATRANAVREGVADRVALCTADMRALPFADGSFDLVTSSLAVHKVPGRIERDQVMAEAVRVLRPGGRLVIADIRATRQYREQLSAFGMVAVTRRGLGWRMWWSGPWLPTHAVAAAKTYLP
jgi:SAM-dependent methyltransferase